MVKVKVIFSLVLWLHTWRVPRDTRPGVPARGHLTPISIMTYRQEMITEQN